ncbi:MAG TPA: hypothetical protein VM716_14515 [Gemmatimonadales bacterium]|nr:hypothetical protein [Gemmatimonadales bacterium]
MGPVARRLAILLDVFSPWDGISLSHREFAAELGKPVTAAAIKKWPQRKSFPANAARLIVRRAQARGLAGVTLEWVLWGDGPGPQKGLQRRVERVKEASAVPAPPVPASPLAHGRHAAAIAAALLADLSHNEFGQWSSVEVQRTVIWALKDLSRRLRTLGFDMGRAFELTDVWAGTVGLPVRLPGDYDERD